VVDMAETDIKKEQFDVLYATLRELQTGLVDSTSKVAGFLLLATGWLATSSTARAFLHADGVVRNLAVAALAGAFVLYACASFVVFSTSRKTLQSLDRLEFLPRDCYANRAISLPVLLIFIVGNFCLFGLAAGLVFRAA
jgi:hypothetical protein